MWGAGPWGPPMMWSFWWIFPLIGLLLCAVFLVALIRLLGSGRGFMCMGGHRADGRDESADLRREIQELREEIKQLKAPR